MKVLLQITILFILFDIITTQVLADRLVQPVILAVDVSGSMKSKLDKVNTAVEDFIDNLDTNKNFKVVLIKFGTFADVVLEREIKTQADKNAFKVAIKSLKVDPRDINFRDTNFDEMLDKIELKLRQLGENKAFILVYSDGISEPTPGSGKPKVDLAALASKKFPADRFNVYLINIHDQLTLTPGSILENMIQKGASRQVIDARPQDLLVINSQIRSDIEKKLDKMIKKTEKFQKNKISSKKRLERLGDFLRGHFKEFLLISALIALGFLGYGIWWVFIDEDPKIKDKLESRIPKVLRARFTLIGSNRPPYIARATEDNIVNIGSSLNCQVRIKMPDHIAVTYPVASKVTFNHGEAFIDRLGRFPVALNGETISKRRRLTSGDVIEIGQNNIQFELVTTTNKTGKESSREFLKPYLLKEGKKQ